MLREREGDDAMVDCRVLAKGGAPLCAISSITKTLVTGVLCILSTTPLCSTIAGNTRTSFEAQLVYQYFDQWFFFAYATIF